MKANWLEVPAGTRLDTDLAQRAAEYDAVKVGDEVLYVLDFGDGLPRFSLMPGGLAVSRHSVNVVRKWKKAA